MNAPGHDPGQPSAEAAPGQAGLNWGSYLSGLVTARGSLAAVAEHLAAQRGYQDDVASVERALRRLRQRGQRDGGVWGRRVIAVFGMPSDVERRIRWMGQYHSRFSDLPTSICRELLLPWNRPPVSESQARIWVHLGLASTALRLRDQSSAAEWLGQAQLAAAMAPAAARVELALCRAYLLGRSHHDESVAQLAVAETALEAMATTAAEKDPREMADYACLQARLVDQQAYNFNKPRVGEPNHQAALSLYETLPDAGPPFARCRKHNGMGWSLLKLGHGEAALRHARASVSIAGDGGSLRLRAMALNLLAAAQGSAGHATKERARAIAARLEDEDLQLRYGASQA